MEENAVNSSGEAGLHEYVDAEFIVKELNSPSREKALRDALETVSGLKSLNISNGKLTVHYEPAILLKKQLEEAIQRAGFQISEADATASSPLTDALAEEIKPPEST